MCFILLSMLEFLASDTVVKKTAPVATSQDIYAGKPRFVL